MDERPRVLIVATFPDAGEALGRHLEEEGFEHVDSDPGDVLDEVAACDIALVLLDVGGADGLRLCERLRAASGVPIILLAAEQREAERVLALELGADDVVAKPFSAPELVARIRSVLRRNGLAQARPIQIGDLLLDPAARRVTKCGHPLELAPKQFNLLHLLMQNSGVVVRRERLMNEVWDGRWVASTKTLDVHIAWLRAKIEDDPARPRYITTLRGIGFRFASPAELADAV